MSEDRKGISLRKKKTNGRPQISAPRPVPLNDVSPERTPFNGGDLDSRSMHSMQSLQRTDTSQSSLRGRPSMAADRTADLVKRRYSTRFVGQIDHSAPPPMPAMPAIPSQYQNTAPPPGAQDAVPTTIGTRGLKVDMRRLRDADLVPEQYIAQILADADASEIAQFQTELRKLKNRTSTDLQHNVFQNRTQFIKISKEAEKLKTEMRTLRGLMMELTSALHHVAQAGGAEVQTLGTLDRKRSNRSSVANLEALWSSHLHTLWKRVEGSQKYLPAVPGRHIIYESSRWVELNTATWKPRRRVHLILLNDHLLVAAEKKRADGVLTVSPNLGSGRRTSVAGAPAPTQTTLVAERCFPLAEVTMNDISRSTTSKRDQERHNVSNAVTVRGHTESWTFATGSSSDSAAEKNTLLVSFRKASEELRKALAAEHGDREKALDELALLTSTSDRRGSSKASSPLLSLSGWGVSSVAGDRLSSASTLIDVDGRQQPLRWVDAQIDGLDIDIALQRFEDAVGRTEKLRRLARSIRGNVAAQEMFMAKIDERASRLASVICRRLRLHAAGLERTRENVAWLVRLGMDEVAVREYLSARTETVRLRVRQLPFTGALPPHVTALSYVTFTLALHTLKVFNASFPGSNYTSAAIKWVKERVDEFNDALARQLSSVDPASELFALCVGIAKDQAQVLREVGVDFDGFVGRGVEEGGGGRVLGESPPPPRAERGKVDGGGAVTPAANATTNTKADGTRTAKEPDGLFSPRDEEGRRLGSKGVGVGKRMF